MEIVELLNASERVSLYRYFATRFDWQVVFVLPCLLVLLALVANKNWGFLSALVSFSVALSLIVPFRLADDLADRARDQLRYPDRELCKTDCLQSYWLVLALLAIVVALIVFSIRGMFALEIYAVTVCVFAFWYTFRNHMKSSPILNYHVVLTKYIAFEFILTAPASGNSAIDRWWSGLTAYLVLLLWEVVHDDTIRRSATARRLAMIECFSWLGWTLWIAL